MKPLRLRPSLPPYPEPLHDVVIREMEQRPYTVTYLREYVARIPDLHWLLSRAFLREPALQLSPKRTLSRFLSITRR